MTSTKRWLWIGALLGLLAVAGRLPPAQAAEVGVSIRDNFFDPQSRTALQGDTVTWTH